MNSSPDPLSERLQEWRLQPSPSADFRARVWQRLDAARAASWGAYLRGHWLGWSAAALLTVALSGTAGHVAARAHSDAEREAMVMAYLTDLDPRIQARLRE